MNTKEPKRTNARISVKIIEQIPESVMSKSVTKKSDGNINILSFNEGEGQSEEISPFDTFIQIIEGSAEIIIEGISHFLKTGHILILPAHHLSIIKANTGFKMLSTSIKSFSE